MNTTVTLEAEVVGYIQSKSCSLSYQENISLLEIGNHQMVFSQTFGPHDRSCQVQVSPFTDDTGNLTHISCHLYCVPMEEEKYNDWKRSIATFSLKLLDPITKEVIASKYLTGGFLFSNSSPCSGWDTFLKMEDFSRLGLSQVLMHVIITWDPDFDPFPGSTKAVIDPSLIAELEWLRAEYANVPKNNDSDLKLELARTELAELRQRVKLLVSELEESRLSENEHRVSQVKFHTAKERLSKLRMALEDGLENRENISESDIETELKACKVQLASLYHEKAQVDLKLSQALSELQFVNRSSKDNVLLAPIPTYEEQILAAEVDPLEKIMQSIETAGNETMIGRAAIEELESKISLRTISSIPNPERAGFIADLSMVQCGLDVSYATLCEVAESLHLLPDVSEFLHAQKELQDIRRIISEKKAILEERKVVPMVASVDITNSVLLGVAPPTDATSPLSPPPVGFPSVYPPTLRGKRSSAPIFNEIEQQNDLKNINTRIENLADILKTNVINTTIPVGSSFRPADIEPWTPKEGNSILDNDQLKVFFEIHVTLMSNRTF